MKSEQKAEIILWDWLKTKSSDVVEVFFNSKNELNWKTFNVKGCQEKPDLLVVFNSGYGDRFCAVEVKPTIHSRGILSARKILNYCKTYLEGKTEYFIEGKKIEIDYFLIATESSPKGYLFKKEILIDNLEEKEKVAKRLIVTKFKSIPIREGHRTFEFVRTLWNIFKDNRNDFEKKCGIGILIANSEDNFSPYMMVNSYNKNNQKWGQRWWKI